MKAIISLMYVMLGAVHIFIVKDVMLLVILVGLFEAVRLLAVFYKIRLVIVVLAVFSCMFIGSNYYNTYENNTSKNNQKEVINKQINRYVNKYWVSQETFKQLVNKQESLSETQNLPSIYMILGLIVLIEMSLAYIVCVRKEEEIKGTTKKIKEISGIAEGTNEVLKSIMVDPSAKAGTEDRKGIKTLNCDLSNKRMNKGVRKVDLINQLSLL